MFKKRKISQILFKININLNNLKYYKLIVFKMMKKKYILKIFFSFKMIFKIKIKQIHLKNIKMIRYLRIIYKKIQIIKSIIFRYFRKP